MNELLNSKKIKLPLYIQIQETLKEMINGSEYDSGDQIPSERELAEKLPTFVFIETRIVLSLRESKIVLAETLAIFICGKNKKSF